MKRLLPSLLLCCWLAAGPSNPAWAGADDISARGWRMLKAEPNLEVEVAVESTSLYLRPDDTSEVVRTDRWMSALNIDGRYLEIAPKGWLPILAPNEGPPMWVRRRDIVIGDGMKKVIGCWPIKSIYVAMGDYAVEITFKRDGSGLAREFMDDPAPGLPARDRVQVYMERDVVEIFRLRTGRADIFRGGYQPDSGVLYVMGEPVEKQENFPARSLKGCAAGPRLKP